MPQDGDDVTFEEVIENILVAIRAGCKQAGDHGTKKCFLSPEAEEFVKRRYKASIEEKLKHNQPGDWKNRHKEKIDKVAFAHGQIAGSVWQFQQRLVPNPPPKVDVVTLAKAGHIMELECQSFLAALSRTARAHKREKALPDRGGYCW